MNIDDVMRRGTKRTKRRILGRGTGSGLGTTAGRGQKGDMARSGFTFRALFEGGQMPLSRRSPKRGFNNKWRVEYEVINLDQLAKRFQAGETVDLEAIRRVGIIKDPKALVKILGRGEITASLHVKAHKFSASAKEKIEKAGGTVATVVE